MAGCCLGARSAEVTSRRVLGAERDVRLSGLAVADPRLTDLGQLRLGPAERVPDPFGALSHARVTLHDLRESEALFLEVPEGCDVCSFGTGAFFYEAQLRCAERAFYVPVPIF